MYVKCFFLCMGWRVSFVVWVMKNIKMRIGKINYLCLIYLDNWKSISDWIKDLLVIINY